ncbi:hypothetical protein [Xenorhabdus cabanillasii]|uniref:Uncharacterized protein n=1 Tax=Xenorhabdus cabanillasii JM26 TaxID=1427517 RepID=W1IVC1_9GAMM|nr:hypothetical protein [Xenorhabdus cabanillasii]PHM77951.1 hypothetical protein Xcab_01463 [Xenorhabdus cabanillasii JM26]CDL81561.1 conserved hypothetical protein [Xenorhabdus cabanillasii JM26]
MNKLPDNSIIVRDIVSNTLELMITKNENELVNKMKLLGFSLVTNELRDLYAGVDLSVDPFVDFMKLSVDNEDSKLKIIKSLISEGALFSYGRSWSPAEVMDYYKKDKKIISEKYKVISWASLETYYIEEIE